MNEREDPAIKSRTPCPRCGEAFVCRSDVISACHCGQVALDAALRRAIAERYHGCLCATCLRQIAKGAAL